MRLERDAGRAAEADKWAKAVKSMQRKVVGRKAEREDRGLIGRFGRRKR